MDIEQIETEYNKKQKIMKTILRISFPLALATVVFVAFMPFRNDSDTKDRVTMQLVYQVLTHAHYDLINVNDEFSSKVFDEYIDWLDYAKRYFLKSDLQQLEKYRYLIDDQIKMSNLDFFDEVTQLIIQRQNEAEQYYREAIASNFDFKTNEDIETDPKKLKFSATKEELRKNWYKITKLAVLEKLSDLTDIQESSKNDSAYKMKSMDELKAEAVKSVKENYDKWMDRLSKIK